MIMQGFQKYYNMKIEDFKDFITVVHDNRMKKNSTKLCTEINIKFETKSSIRLFLDINYL